MNELLKAIEDYLKEIEVKQRKEKPMSCVWLLQEGRKDGLNFALGLLNVLKAVEG